MHVTIYTDGGADPNPGIGGWAAILRDGDREQILTGNNPQTTNSRMELQAAISALQALKRPSDIEFHTDSQYVRRGITEWIEGWAAKGWRLKGDKPVKNDDLWQALWAEVQKHQITWHWVRGHAGDVDNKRVDTLARQARLAITPEVEIGTNSPQLYVRSSCKGNPGPGGWGVVLAQDDETEQFSGSELSTTNSRMELTAVIEGLLKLPPGSPAQVFTTSDYVFQGATRWVHGWRQHNWQKQGGTAVANADLWQRLDQLMGSYRMHWINAKGQDLPLLATAARLAAEAATSA